MLGTPLLLAAALSVALHVTFPHPICLDTRLLAVP